MSEQTPMEPDGQPQNPKAFAGTPSVAGPSFAAPETRVDDLSSAIIDAVPRSAGEQVRCRRIVGDRYRCNWWAASNDIADNRAGVLNWTTYRVVRSQVLSVQMTRSGLVMEPMAQQ